MINILLIDDDENLRRVTELQLVDLGYKVTTSPSGEDGLIEFKKNEYDVVVTDIVMPGMNGIEVLISMKEMSPETIVILVTAFGTIDDALSACEEGASDYVVKPFNIQQLVFAFEKAIRLKDLEEKNITLTEQLKERFKAENIVGNSSKMQEVLRLVEKVAKSNSTVMILGESGTGKELVAKAIHFNSPRADKNFVTVNCASIPDTLIESELFGHEKGAFTGAIKSRIGKFEQANGGSIFLDEIGDLKADLQAKLLRVLQEREIQKVGSDELVSLDIRIIAATHQKLEKKIKTGEFREDLYYRLSVVPITIPPLREHREDIPDLIDHFIKKYSIEGDLEVDKSALVRLKSYHYPGNVRELENIIERAITLSENGILTTEDVDYYLEAEYKEDDSDSIILQDMTLHEIEIKAISSALKKAHGNQSKAADMLGIPRHILLYRLKKYNISKL